MICPKCDGDVDRLVMLHWGQDPNAELLVAPYVCGWCSSLLLIDQSNMRLIDAFTDNPELLDILKANETLWMAITKAQTDIRKLHQRRPVLR